MSTEFIIRDYVPEDEDMVLALIQQGMGGGPTGMREKGFWNWKHFDNPFGPSIALVAEHRDGQIIGLRTFMQWRFQARERELKAVRAVDTVTHPGYRRYGVFSVLTRKAVEAVGNNGINFIYNTPNATVLPGYLKLGWKLVTIIRPQIKILNYPRFLMGIARSKGKRQAATLDLSARFFKKETYSMEDFLKQEEAIEKLLQLREQRRDSRIHTRHTVEYLRWRYLQYPFVDYRVVCHQDRDDLKGCIIFRPNGRLGMKEIVLSEFLMPEEDKDIASSMVKDMIKQLDADYIVAYFPKNSYEYKVLRKAGFYNVPFQGINFAENTLNAVPGIEPQQFDNWDLSLGDLEIF